MKISPVSTKINTISTYRNKTNKQSNSINSNGFVSYPANYYVPSFRGVNLAKMYEEYNWYINHDKIPAIKSFLKMSAPKEEMDKFLTHILNTKDRSYELIDSIVAVPREGIEILKALSEKIGQCSQNLLTFIPGSPYNVAYQRYTETKFQNAGTLNELLKIRPDWSGDKLLEKYDMMNGHTRLKIGKLPNAIPKEHLGLILGYLRDKMEVGLKQNKKIDDLVLDGKTYQFKFFTEGKSSKNVFGFFIPCCSKKYVIKMEEPEKRSLDDPFALGTLAKIDSYLTANRSRNSAPLCYYNYRYNFSIYKYIEHIPVEDNDHDINTIRRKLPDFRALGLDYNDTVGYKNLFKLDAKSSDTHHKLDGYHEALNKSEWISVDNDHVTYSGRLQPSVSGYHKSLPNAMGMFF